jgi:hypothetical protein
VGNHRASEIDIQGVPALIPNGFLPRGNTPLTSRTDGPQSSTIRTSSPVVDRHLNHQGIRRVLGIGGYRMPMRSVPEGGPHSGMVPGSPSQPYVAAVHAFNQNDALFIAGRPQNLGVTFKVARPNPALPTGLLPMPRFTSVQRVNRPSGAPSAYNTQSAGQ